MALRGLVRAVIGPPEEIGGHEDGDHEHQGRQDDFTTHFWSPGQRPGADAALEPARHPFLQYRASETPRRANGNSSRYPGNICGFYIYLEISPALSARPRFGQKADAGRNELRISSAASPHCSRR
jgi:hypothetical protein